MKVQCPHCKAKFSAREEYSGKKVKCLKCNMPFIVNFDGQDAMENHAYLKTELQTTSQSESPSIEMNGSKNMDEIHFSMIPQKFRQYLHLDEKILYASNPSKGALFLKIIIPAFFLIISFLMMFSMGFSGLLSVLFWGVLTLIIYLSWKNEYYIVTDKRTFAAEGIFNVAVSIIPNKSIQMVCINTGVIDKLLGLNTLEISSAAQGGTNIFRAFLGKSKGTIKLSAIARVQEVIKIYHPVFA